MNKDSKPMETALLNGKPMIADSNVVEKAPVPTTKRRVVAKKRIALAKTARPR